MLKIFFVSVFLLVNILLAQKSEEEKNILLSGQRGTKYGRDFIFDIKNPLISGLLKEQFGFGKTYDEIKVPAFYLDKHEVSIAQYKNFLNDFAEAYLNGELDEKLRKIFDRNIILKTFYEEVFVNESDSLRKDLRTNIETIRDTEKERTRKNTLYFVYDGNNKLVDLEIGDLKVGGPAGQVESDFLKYLKEKLKEKIVFGYTKDKNLKLLFYLFPYCSDKQRNLDYFYLSPGGNSEYGLFPVTGIDYYCAMLYAAWNNKRLPTEIEFETAGKYRKINTGVAIENKYEFKNADFPCEMITPENPEKFRLPVNYAYENKDNPSDYIAVNHADFIQNGFYHLVGNVAEWQADSYLNNPYQALTIFKNKTPHEIILDNAQGEIDKFKKENDQAKKMNRAIEFFTEKKAVRGGHYNSTLFFLRIQTRTGFPATYRSSTIGFRCAIDYGI